MFVFTELFENLIDKVACSLDATLRRNSVRIRIRLARQTLFKHVVGIKFAQEYFPTDKNCTNAAKLKSEKSGATLSNLAGPLGPCQVVTQLTHLYSLNVTKSRFGLLSANENALRKCCAADEE